MHDVEDPAWLLDTLLNNLDRESLRTFVNVVVDVLVHNRLPIGRCPSAPRRFGIYAEVLYRAS